MQQHYMHTQYGTALPGAIATRLHESGASCRVICNSSNIACDAPTVVLEAAICSSAATTTAPTVVFEAARQQWQPSPPTSVQAWQGPVPHQGSEPAALTGATLTRRQLRHMQYGTALTGATATRYMRVGASCRFTCSGAYGNYIVIRSSAFDDHRNYSNDWRQLYAAALYAYAIRRCTARRHCHSST
jgi:hypothetical protein